MSLIRPLIRPEVTDLIWRAREVISVCFEVALTDFCVVGEK